MANWCCVEYEAALVCCEVEESWGFKKVERDDEREQEAGSSRAAPVQRAEAHG